MIETTIPQEVKSQFSDAQSAAQGVIDTAKSGVNLSSMLREAVAERFTNSPLNPQREAAASQLLTSAPRARADVASLVQAGAAGQPGGQILSPNQQQSVIASRRAADTVPLLTLNDLIQARGGDIDTAVAGGLQGFQTLLGAQQAGAQLKQQIAESALSQFLSEQDLSLKASAEARAGGQGSFLKSIMELLGQQGSGGGAQVNQGNVNIAMQNAPDDRARQEIANNPGIGLISVQGMSEELPVYAPEGTVATDDQTGISVIYQGGNWQPYSGQQSTKKGFLSSLFGG